MFGLITPLWFRRGSGVSCLSLVVLVVLSLSAAVALEAPIAPSVAGLFVGQEKVVEGPITAAEREANVVHLQLGTPPQHLQISIVMNLLSDFPAPPDQYYLGKIVRVSGKISRFRGQPEVVVHAPEQIAVLRAIAPTPHSVLAWATAPTPTPTTVPAPTVAHVPTTAPPVATPVLEKAPLAPSLAQQVAALAARVADLEQRLHTLEQACASPTPAGRDAERD